MNANCLNEMRIHNPKREFMIKYGCSSDDANRYFDLRAEGYSHFYCMVKCGLTDPISDVDR